MKKIFTLLTLLLSIAAYGQTDTVMWTISDFDVPSRPTTPDFVVSETYKINQGLRNTDSLLNVIDVTDSSAVFTTIDVDSTVTRVLNYDPPHGALNFADSSTLIDLTQNVWQKLTGPAGDLFVVRDQDDMTIAGDSITIEVPGDYMTWISLSFDGVNQAVFHIAIYVNTVITTWEFHRKTSANDTGNAGMPAYLKDLAIGDDISIWITNTGNSGDATMISGQWTITMLHPD